MEVLAYPDKSRLGYERNEAAALGIQDKRNLVLRWEK